MGKVTDEQRIQISRDKYIEQSRAIAYLSLKSRNFLKGEICMVNYYKEKDYLYNNDKENSIGVLIAIGVEDGKGEDCFRIISAGGTIPVRGVIDSTVDVSKLVHNELYVYHDLDKDSWNYIKAIDTNDELKKRNFEIITGGPFIFLDLTTGYRWFYSNQSCKREDDFFSSNQFGEVLQSYISADLKIDASILEGYLFKYGQVDNINIKIELKNPSGKIVNGKCKFYLNEQEITLDKNNIYNYKIDKFVDQDFNIEAKYFLESGITVSYYQTLSIKFGYTFYFGEVSNTWIPSLDSIMNLSGNRLSYEHDFQWDDIVLDNQKTVFAYPICYKRLEHIFDVHGIDYIHSYQEFETDIVIDDQAYRYYILKNPIDISDFRQCFVFTDTESLDLEEYNLLNLLTAWKSKNKSEGLLVLDRNGKIPENILENIESSSSFLKIKDIVTEYPNSGMTVGDLYYNKITNKLFRATSDTEGKIENPDSDHIYSCNNSLYYWTGLSLQPLSGFGSREIKTIEEIYG